MTSTYDLTCTLGSGVLPPVQESMNKNKRNIIRTHSTNPVERAQTIQLTNIYLHICSYQRYLPNYIQIYNGSYSHSILMKNKQVDKEKSWVFCVLCGLKWFSQQWCRGPGLCSSEYVHFQCQGSSAVRLQPAEKPRKFLFAISNTFKRIWTHTQYYTTSAALI